MSPERNPKRSKSPIRNNGKQLKSNPMADCVLPDDIMMIILLRLPVKSLLRFKAVCKPWLRTFAAPNFIRAHHHFSGKAPAKISYHHPEYYLVHTMSLFKIESNEKTKTAIDFDRPIFFRMNYVGCCGGLICLGLPRLGQVILLWNPAMKLYKFLPLSKVDFGDPVMYSLGFGYDEEAGDFKVVRVVYVKGEKIRAEVEVYSSVSDTWETIKLDFQFQVFTTRNTAVVDGNPLWLAKIGESRGGIDNCFMVWFDVREMAFKKATVANPETKDEPFANFEIENGNHIPLLDRKLSVMVFDEDDGGRPVPVELKVQSSKNGKIVEFCLNGKVFVFDPEKGCVRALREISTEEGTTASSEVTGYCESLARVEGMKPLMSNKVQDTCLAMDIL